MNRLTEDPISSLPMMLIMGILVLLGGAGVSWFAFQLLKPDRSKLPPVSNATLNVSVIETGFHAVSPSDLETKSGLELGSWTNQPVAITEQGKPVPYLIQNDQLIFFGREQDSIYSRERVYQLHFGDAATGKSHTFKRFPAGPNPRLASAQSTIVRLAHFEQDERYVSIARSEKSLDTWYWDQIHVSETFEMTADLPHAADGSATFTAHLFGVSHDARTENDHDLDLLINGKNVAQIVWDGNNHFYPQIELPAGSIKAGQNEIVLDNRPEGNTFIDISEFDWLSIDYRANPVAESDHIHFKTQAATLELSGFSGEPVVLAFFKDGSAALAEGIEHKRRSTALTVPQAAELFATGPKGFLAPKKITLLPTSNLKAVTPQADMIIISDDELAPELAPLVAARQAQGLAVTVATVEEIYNQFGYGQPSPQAIQVYLADALINWPTPAPRYLFLVGSTTYDYRNNLESERLQSERLNRVPSILVGVEHSGETVSDTQLADANGDGRADFAVGRWPVNTPEQVASLVKRTLAYEQTQVSEQVLFSADGTLPDFGNTADRLITAGRLLSTNPTRAYGASWEAMTNHWNSGNWMVTYVGHGSVDLWGSQEVLSSERVAGLQNPLGIAPPIVLQFTCLTGFFAHPTQPSISEEMLLHENGPVLIVSATSLTYSSSQEPLATGIVSRLADPSFVRMGDVMSQSRAELSIEFSSVKEVYDTFVLLGDPATIIGRPESILAAVE